MIFFLPNRVYSVVRNGVFGRYFDFSRHSLYRSCSSISKKQKKDANNRVNESEILRTRNIGIMAHIDAGKTTTTERMLYHAGFMKHIGDVDDGDTVMDYMEQERDRGITITSAAITFTWKGHRINLIDTPGHVDFTMEVERALRVLDGAVAILDASAGVEAQTLTVWRQAKKYRLPRLLYLNKMDKPTASFRKCLSSIRDKLGTIPLPIQIPIGSGKTFQGHIDLLTMESYYWPSESRLSNGVKFNKCKVKDEDRDLAEKYREQLIDQLAELDDSLAEVVIKSDNYDDIPVDALQNAIRRVTSSVSAVPVLCGTSLRNTGVQSLMDAVVNYLPNPMFRPVEAAQYYGDSLSALAFKIVHDKQRGALTFLRLYSGQLLLGASVYNVNRGITEKTTRLLRAYADEYKDIPSAGAGDIVLVTGLKEAMTGDTLVHSHRTMEQARQLYCDEHDIRQDDDESTITPLLNPLDIPDPVFLCSIEPPSLAQQKALDYALQCLQREDPSFHVHVDTDSGQTILSGMGELHLEVIHDRIRSEYGIDTDLGELQISYREAIVKETEHTGSLTRTMGDKQQQASMTIKLRRADGHGMAKTIEMVYSKDNDLDKVKRPHFKAIENGALSGLKHGPLLGFPVLDVQVELHEFSYKYGTSLAFISACASDTVQKALQKVNTVLLEPMMDLQIITDEDYLSTTLGDLSRRRAHISDIVSDDPTRTVIATVPLSELLGYSTALRTITSGTATFSMEVATYQPMAAKDQQKAVQRVTGFAA